MCARSRYVLMVMLSFFSVSLAADFYRWTDENGRTVFGDSPPESLQVERVILPTLTVAERFSTAPVNPLAASGDAKDATASASGLQSVNYESFKIISPEQGAALRANDGNVSIQFELKPALQAGHGLVVYLDGKQVGTSRSPSLSLSGLDRGEHTVFAVVHDANNSILSNTERVTFSVLKAIKKLKNKEMPL